MNRVTISDIATAANVSKSTVSRVLNGTAAVAPEKKRAVLAATERLGFEPNVVARSLASGRSMTIGVLTQLIGSPFYDTIAQGVIAGLNATGYSPVFVDGQWQSDSEREGIRTLLGRRVDGMILIGGGVSEDDIASACAELPTVVVARRLAGIPSRCISVDNVDGGYRATKHLIDNGHRRIAILRGLMHHPDAVDRFQGYERAFKEAGLPLDPGLILDGDFSPESGVRCVNELIARGERFTAVFAANDMTAFGARLALDRHNKRVPGDVSLIGFDDQMEAAFTTPPLTTIRQPAREMGHQAATAVLQMINGEEPSLPTVQCELIQRESVSALPT